jgi:hypothetical protein
MRPLALSALSLTVLLTGCDLFGGESAEAVAARREAEGKAVGSACRHAMRAIEDCYTLNPKTMKSAVFAGWREMDEYMRENKIDGVAPTIERSAAGKEDGEGAGDAKGKPTRTAKASAAKAGKAERGDKADKADTAKDH